MRCPCPGMTRSTPARHYGLGGFRGFARAAAAAVILIGGSLIAGWAFEAGLLKQVSPGMVAMNPGSRVLAFLLAGASLWIKSGPAGRRPDIIARACASVVVVLALLRLGAYLLG